MNTGMATCTSMSEAMRSNRFSKPVRSVFSRRNSNRIIMNINLSNQICADGICCFMSIPRNHRHLGIGRFFMRRRNASYGVKLLYTAVDLKDVVYNPCRCLEFYLSEGTSQDGASVQVTVRCGIFGKRYRPYTCSAFPDKADSFAHNVPAPCAYNDYLAPDNYMELKHKCVFQVYFAIKDDRKLLKKIFPGHTAEEAREWLNRCDDVVKISAIWNEKPSEYFLFKVPKADSALYVSGVHPKITSVKQAYRLWQGHIEGWLEKHYGSSWEAHLNGALEKERVAAPPNGIQRESGHAGARG